MKQLGKYKIIKELGSGGFGAVYLARDPRLGEQVAIKLFRIKDEALAAQATSATADAANVLKERFLNEARILRRLSSNPYIVDMFEFEELDDGTPWYVMPYLTKSLTTLIGRDIMNVKLLAETPAEERPRPLPLNQCLLILRQLLVGLKAVHKAGLIHRDIKPANILFNDQEEVQLADFGIAKLPDEDHSMSGVGMGSRRYMSPEQRESAKHVDARSDIYSVGVLAYRMITGSLPIGRYNDPKHYIPQMGDALNDLIITCLSQSPEERPYDAGDMLKKLDKAMDSISEEEMDEASSTDIEGPTVKIRDELSSIRDSIEELLLEHGEVPTSEMAKLTPLAAILDLDKQGLQSLIQDVIGQNNAQIKPLRNFLQVIDQSLDETSQNLSDDTVTGLVAAGESIGWDEDRVRDTIRSRTKKPEKKIKNTPSTPKPKTANDNKFLGKLIKIGVVCAVLGGMGYGYAAWRAGQEEASEKFQMGVTMRQNDEIGWEEATRLKTLAGFEAYLEAWPQGKYRANARAEIAKIKEATRLASLNAEDRKKEQVKRIQISLTKLGYAVPRNGIADIRTKTAIENFEKNQNLLVTGIADEVILEKLISTINKQDTTDWKKAQKNNTEQSYNTYARTWPDGQYISFVSVAIKKAKDDYAYNLAEKKNTVTSFKTYISRNSKGQHIEQAKSNITRLENETAQRQLISKIQKELQRLDYSKVTSRNGILDNNSIYAIRHFEKNTNRPVTGKATNILLKALSLAIENPLKVGKTFRDCSKNCPEMIVLPSGSFRMGAIQGPLAKMNRTAQPVHNVNIGYKLAVGKFEITFKEFDTCVDEGGCTTRPNKKNSNKRNKYPVIQVNWNDMQQYVRWLSQKTGEKYRLLSEAEWEYAARAGTTTKYSWGNNIGLNNANCAGCMTTEKNKMVWTMPVGSFEENAFGLYDMHGNVFEVVQDCWQENYRRATRDGRPTSTNRCGKKRASRGGSFFNDTEAARSAYRFWYVTENRSSNIGFRVARVINY